MATPILDTIIADINAIVPQYSSIVSSYRLLVGSAEEISRMPGVPREIYERAVCRYDRAGTLIDILQELLCCKIRFWRSFSARRVHRSIFSAWRKIRSRRSR